MSWCWITFFSELWGHFPQATTLKCLLQWIDFGKLPDAYPVILSLPILDKTGEKIIEKCSWVERKMRRMLNTEFGGLFTFICWWGPLTRLPLLLNGHLIALPRPVRSTADCNPIAYSCFAMLVLSSCRAGTAVTHQSSSAMLCLVLSWVFSASPVFQT